jgi:hypothetical protein
MRAGHAIADFQTAHTWGGRLYSSGAFEITAVEACRRLA